MNKKPEDKAAADWNELMRRWSFASAAYEAASAALVAALQRGGDASKFEADKKAASTKLEEIKLAIGTLIGTNSAARRPSPDSLIIAFMDDHVTEDATEKERVPRRPSSASQTSNGIGKKVTRVKP